MATLVREISLLIVLAVAVLLPGAALLVLSGAWRRWAGLQLYLAAAGLGLAFYPILFYLARALLPGVGLNRWVLTGLLLVSLAVTLLGMWKERAFLGRPERLEWVALLVLGLILGSRFWFGHQHPFPAWSDSLHHTLLTELTAASGLLPHTLEPYFPNVLDMYHMGLYALSGSLQILTGVAAHESLLWTAQFLNALCGIGIYLVLDRFSSRVGAILGLAIAGLFSVHPALWANWGRFTQLSSVVLLPIAWAFFLELVLPRDGGDEPSSIKERAWLVIFAAVAGAGVFLYHFRVGIFYLLLLGATVLVVLIIYRSRQRWLAAFRALLLSGLGIVILILPALWAAASAYFSTRAAVADPVTADESEQVVRNYFHFPWSSVPYLAAPIWLLVIGGAAAITGIITRNVLILISLLWSLLMIAAGNLYLLGIPALNFTNLGAVLIMLYIPLSVMIGAALNEGFRRLPARYLAPATTILIVAILAAGLLAARSRAQTVELYRHFVTEADVAAMQWIEANTPAEATFAINTYRWLPQAIHGTDAGYWIPYFTGRDIVTSAMLADGLPADYRRLMLARSEAALALESDLAALDTLRDLGVDYIYIGAVGDFSGPGLQVDFLSQSDAVKLLYDQGGAAVLQILPNNTS